MSTLPFLSFSAAGVLLFTASTGFTQEERPVAFRAKTGEYVGTIPQGGLRVSSKIITVKQIFQLIDVNGGELEDNDEIKIKETAASDKPSFWQESGETVARVAKPDAACVFKVKKNDKTIKLQTASGKYVAVANRAVILADETVKTTDFEVIENPTAETPEAKPAAPAPSSAASPSPAKKSTTL